MPRSPAFKRDIATIHEFAATVIAERRVEASSGRLAQREDVLARFLELDDASSDEQLRDVVLNFILAGRDTTAQLLTASARASWRRLTGVCAPLSGASIC